MKKKMSLKELKVNSFTTHHEPKMKTVAGGFASWGLNTYCGNTCQPSCNHYESCGSNCNVSWCICD